MVATKRSADIEADIEAKIHAMEQRVEEVKQKFKGEVDALLDELHGPTNELIESYRDLRSSELGEIARAFGQEMEAALARHQENLVQQIDRLIEARVGGMVANTPAMAAKGNTRRQPRTGGSPRRSTQKKKSAEGTTNKVGSKASAKKTAAAKPAPAPPAADVSELLKLEGMTRAVAKRLAEKGITQIRQIAEPSEADNKILAEFNSLKKFSTWESHAKEIVAG